MKVDAMSRGSGLAELAVEAREREREATGIDGLWSYESPHDPFLPLMPVAEHTSRVAVGTAIAVAFARSPMSTAFVGHDLQVHSSGSRAAKNPFRGDHLTLGPGKGPAMLAVVAAVLFGLALLFELAGISLAIITSQLLVIAGLLCIALYMAGVGTRHVTYRRRARR
jgi:hypothetical protein